MKQKKNKTVKRLNVAGAALGAGIAAACVCTASGAVRERVFPKTVALIQTENYQLSETQTGWIGRYVDQPLCVDPDMDQSSPWGSYLPQSEVEQAQRDAKSYGFDGMCAFPNDWRVKGWINACGHSSVKDCAAYLVNHWFDPGKNFDNIALSITNSVSRLPDGRSLVFGYWNRTPAYWSKTGVEPELMQKWLDGYRAKFGNDFIVVMDVPEAGSGRFRREYELTGDLCEDSRLYLRRIFRENLRVVDGLSVGETHSMNRFDREIRTTVHEPGYLRLVFGILRDVLEESEFKGKKLLVMGIVLGHENAYTRAYNISHNGTRTLRGVLEVALEMNPDIMKFGEWDEYNENTCFAPTLYNGYVTKRIVRSYLQKLRGEKLTPLEGDDLSKPNLAVSYRKSLSPGEPLAVEVLNIADGSGEGTVETSVEVLDENGRVLKKFDPKLISADTTSDHRFVTETDRFFTARALQIRVFWKTRDGRSGVIGKGLHPVDFAPANSWNHKWVKTSLRDLAPMEKCEVSLKDGVVCADLKCASPVRYAMVCGGGEILYIHNPEDRIDRFREDDDAAVFQVTFVSCRTKPAAERTFMLDLGDVPQAEWIMDRTTVKGSRYAPSWISAATAPVYLRIPRDKLEKTVLRADFDEIISGEIPLKAAFESGAYTIGAPGTTQVTLSRLNRQASYPSVWNRNDARFSFRPLADRKSMAYVVQVVTMDGKTWRSEPLVWGDVSRNRTLEYDFSPACGEVIRPKNGERGFYGMLGGLYSPATLRNRGPATAGAHGKYRKDWDPRPKQAVSGDAEGVWELQFDGVDDLVGFPTETLPQNSPWELSFEFFPEKLEGFLVEALNEGRGSLYDTRIMPDGSLKTGYLGYFCRNYYSQLILPPRSVEVDRWNRLTIRHSGKMLEVVLNGKSFSEPAPMPGDRPASLLLGGNPNSQRYFKGRIRNFTVRQR